MSSKISIGNRSDGRLILRFSYNPDHISKVKSIDGYRWHPEERYWSVPYEKKILNAILKVFENDDIKIEPEILFDLGYLEILKKELITRRYSAKTIQSYIHYNQEFLVFSKKIPVQITDPDIKKFLASLVDEQKVSTSTLNVAISALKFYYGEILKQHYVYEIKRPKKDKKLPVILSRDEIARILSSVTNVKHRSILMLAYSAGLRVGEVVKLKIEDIDVERKLIHVRAGKGRKDRYTILSDTALLTMAEYKCKYRPHGWLFPGANPEKHITTRTAEAIFDKACKNIKIKKNVSIHSLRHSFATHLLESGISIRYIQELLGHKSSKTTEIYTHVSNTELSKIKNPLDTLTL